jgi:hypothetical protein
VSAYEEFLRGQRPDEILIYLSESVVGDPNELLVMAETTRVEDDGEASNASRASSDEQSESDGVVLVMPGDEGRGAFERATNLDPMDFAGAAMGTEGHVARDCTGGECPKTDEEPGPHDVRFIFAFAEEHNEGVGGIYAEGDVVHAYAACSEGTMFSDKWVADPEFDLEDDAADATPDETA